MVVEVDNICKLHFFRETPRVRTARSHGTRSHVLSTWQMCTEGGWAVLLQPAPSLCGPPLPSLPTVFDFRWLVAHAILSELDPRDMTYLLDAMVCASQAL